VPGLGSDLPTANKRFAATLGELVGGRVGLAYGSVGVLKIVTTIAGRCSLLRQQFGPPNKPEIASPGLPVAAAAPHAHAEAPAYAFHLPRATW